MDRGQQGQVRRERGQTRRRLDSAQALQGKKDARFTISLTYEKQKAARNNPRVLNALLNRARILDIQHMPGTASSGRMIGISLICDRIEWFEHVVPPYGRQMLLRWKGKVEKSGERLEPRSDHNDLSLTVDGETGAGSGNRQLSCAITADATGGYVYRIDADLIRGSHLSTCSTAPYLDDHGAPRTSRMCIRDPRSGRPRFSPDSGRRIACTNRSFSRAVPMNSPHFEFGHGGEGRAERRRGKGLEKICLRLEAAMERIRLFGEEWFGFQPRTSDPRGSLEGMTMRDIDVEADHSVLLKEMLRTGRTVLTTG